MEQQAKIDSIQTIVERQRVIDFMSILVESQKAEAERYRKGVVEVNQTAPAAATTNREKIGVLKLKVVLLVLALVRELEGLLTETKNNSL